LKKVYMDNGATTQVDEKVLEAMLPFYKDLYGNPSSLHSFGRDVKKHLEEAREKVAAAIHADPAEIYFTSGGTEADNLAVQGVARALKKKGNHIITSAIEHHAILDVCKAMEKEGFKVTFLPVDAHGMVDPEAFRAAVTEETILATIMMANNEVGTLQPIAEIGRITREKGILLHTDAVQAIGNVPVHVEELGVDLLTLAAHKFYGPKGIGALYVRRGTRVNKLNYGGGQEKKVRPGTENIPGIVGLGRAIELAVADIPGKAAHLTHLRQKLIDNLLQIKDVKLNGHPEKRLPGNANLSFEYVEGESLLLSLDMKGVAASSGSACTSGSLEPSHVLLAMGLPHQTAHGSLRLTLGKNNTEEEVDYVLEVLPEIVERLRSMSPLSRQDV
jgi:cysteine desulfurase